MHRKQHFLDKNVRIICQCASTDVAPINIEICPVFFGELSIFCNTDEDTIFSTENPRASQPHRQVGATFFAMRFENA